VDGAALGRARRRLLLGLVAVVQLPVAVIGFVPSGAGARRTVGHRRTLEIRRRPPMQPVKPDIRHFRYVSNIAGGGDHVAVTHRR
jgi:hypothetical protein